MSYCKDCKYFRPNPIYEYAEESQICLSPDVSPSSIDSVGNKQLNAVLCKTAREGEPYPPGMELSATDEWELDKTGTWVNTQNTHPERLCPDGKYFEQKTSRLTVAIIPNVISKKTGFPFKLVGLGMAVVGLGMAVVALLAS